MLQRRRVAVPRELSWEALVPWAALGGSSWDAAAWILSQGSSPSAASLPAVLVAAWGTDPGGEENAASPTPVEGACKPWLPHSTSLIALC